MNCNARRPQVVLIAMIAGVLGVCGLWLALRSNALAVWPACPWHISGVVLDNASSTLAGVTVMATGTIRVTTLNKVASTAPETFKVVSTTDQKGRFDLNFQAAFFKLVFTKTGYASKTLIFDDLSPTNQTLTLHVEPESK